MDGLCDPERLVTKHQSQLAHGSVRLDLHDANDRVRPYLLLEDKQFAKKMHLLPTSGRRQCPCASRNHTRHPEARNAKHLRRGEEDVGVAPGVLRMQFLLPLELLKLVLFLELS